MRLNNCFSVQEAVSGAAVEPAIEMHGSALKQSRVRRKLRPSVCKKPKLHGTGGASGTESRSNVLDFTLEVASSPPPINGELFKMFRKTILYKDLKKMITTFEQIFNL